jgi:hypothetical protein
MGGPLDNFHSAGELLASGLRYALNGFSLGHNVSLASGARPAGYSGKELDKFKEAYGLSMSDLQRF